MREIEREREREREREMDGPKVRTLPKPKTVFSYL